MKTDWFADLFTDDTGPTRSINIFKMTATALGVAVMACGFVSAAIYASAETDSMMIEAEIRPRRLPTPPPAKRPSPSPSPKKSAMIGKWSEFLVTAYANGCAILNPETGKIEPSRTGLTASGRPGVHGETVAADPKILPLGSRIHIAGVGEFSVTDTGPVGRHIDLFLDSCDEGEQFGRHPMRIRRIL